MRFSGAILKHNIPGNNKKYELAPVLYTSFCIIEHLVIMYAPADVISFFSPFSPVTLNVLHGMFYTLSLKFHFKNLKKYFSLKYKSSVERLTPNLVPCMT